MGYRFSMMAHFQNGLISGIFGVFFFEPFFGQNNCK